MENATLEEILKQIRTVQWNSRTYQNKKRYNRFHNFVNKSYKEIPWYKQTFKPREVEHCFVNSAIGVMRKLRNVGRIKNVGKTEKSCDAAYKKTNIRNLFLVQELMCQMDDSYWDKLNKIKMRRSGWKQKFNGKRMNFYYDSKYLGKVHIGTYDSTLQWKQEELNKFLKDKEYIFDETNKFGRPLKELKRFLGSTLIKGDVNKWDYYFQRFLSEKE